jgi:sugar lactone lactonase YvrE
VDFSKHTEHITSIVPVADGSSSSCIVGTTEGVAMVNLDTGDFTKHASQQNSSKPLLKPFERMNEGKCDPQGRFWTGSVAKAGHTNAPSIPGGAALYRLDGWRDTGEVAKEPPTKVVAPATICNGIAWTPDHKTMYWIDSPLLGIDAFDFDATTGNVSNRRKVIETVLSPVQLAAGNMFPDGCCLDTQGMLWVCIYNAGEVRRFDPKTSKLLAIVKLPMEAHVETTSCAFAGPDLDELYITTAHKMFTAEQKAQMPLAGALFKVSREELARLGPSIRGEPVHHFKR